MEKQVIDILADKHKDWFFMAKSFGVSDGEANELVQQMYIRVSDYVSDVKKIMYNETEVNTYYVYVTLRNLFLSNFHKIDKRVVYESDVSSASFDHQQTLINLEQEKEYFDKVIDKIDSLVDKWYWYDKRVFKIHFYDQMSMRKIAKETKISLSSIFNTLTNGKSKIKKNAIKEYQKYKSSKG